MACRSPAATFIVGWLAIAGVPPFAGFWSKDEILPAPGAKSPVLWAVGLVTALLTAYYMSRQVFLVFFGDERWRRREPTREHDDEHAPTTPTRTSRRGVDEPPRSSSWPSWPSSAGAQPAAFSDGTEFLEHWLDPVLGEHRAPHRLPTATKVVLAIVAVVAAAGGIAIACVTWYRKRPERTSLEPDILQHGLALRRRPSPRSSAGPGEAAFDGAAAFDQQGRRRRRQRRRRPRARRRRPAAALQTGFVRNYALGIAGGAVLLLRCFVIRAGL